MQAPLKHFQDEGIRFVFVYGSLRPDDDSGQSWTRDACAGMRGQEALVRGARMYKDTYAAVKLNDWQLGKGTRPDNINKETIVHGWVLSCDDELWHEKLALYDAIEGYNSDQRDSGQCLYMRDIVEIEFKEDIIPAGGRKLGEAGQTIRGYIYHRPNAKEDLPIPSGNWMDRKRD